MHQMRIHLVGLALLYSVQAAEIDCTDASPWSTKTTGMGPWKVHHNGSCYTAPGWVDQSNEPGAGAAGSWSPWTLAGTCKAGTANDKATLAQSEDCTGVQAWTGTTTYSSPGLKVHLDGVLYQSKWYSEGDKPDPENKDGPWLLVGGCIKGSDSGGQDTSAPVYPDWMMDLTCLCCDNCGSIHNGQVVCKNVSEDKCFFKWCGDAGKKDETACKDAKDKEKFAWWTGEMAPSKQCWARQFYMPYFDAGLYGWPPLNKLREEHGVDQYVVAFVVSTSSPPLQNGKCQGAYAGAISIEAGPTYEKDGKFSYLYDELNELRKNGGDFVISFGGANGIELADNTLCQTGDAVQNLVDEYDRILTYTNSQRIDFDIEGFAISSINKDKGWTYRFKAVKKLKEKRNGKLHVMYTLPILPTGLTADGEAFIDLMMELDSPWDIFNVMNMDYGECPAICDNDHIDKCERDAMENLAKQMYIAAKTHNKLDQYGWSSVDDVYAHLGSTPMIGQNDTPCLVYKVSDAETNVQHFKTEKPLRMISNWSIARDHPCAASKNVQVDCSTFAGQTKDYEFLDQFKKFNE